MWKNIGFTCNFVFNWAGGFPPSSLLCSSPKCCSRCCSLASHLPRNPFVAVIYNEIANMSPWQAIKDKSQENNAGVPTGPLARRDLANGCSDKGNLVYDTWLHMLERSSCRQGAPLTQILHIQNISKHIQAPAQIESSFCDVDNLVLSIVFICSSFFGNMH